MSLKDGIVFWTIIPNYETKARVSFYRCLWNTYKGNVGFKEYFRYVRTLLTYFNNRGSFRISSCYLFYYRIEFDSLTNNNWDWGNRKAFKAIGVQLGPSHASKIESFATIWQQDTVVIVAKLSISDVWGVLAMIYRYKGSLKFDS